MAPAARVLPPALTAGDEGAEAGRPPDPTAIPTHLKPRSGGRLQQAFEQLWRRQVRGPRNKSGLLSASILMGRPTQRANAFPKSLHHMNTHRAATTARFEAIAGAGFDNFMADGTMERVLDAHMDRIAEVRRLRRTAASSVPRLSAAHTQATAAHVLRPMQEREERLEAAEAWQQAQRTRKSSIARRVEGIALAADFTIWKPQQPVIAVRARSRGRPAPLLAPAGPPPRLDLRASPCRKSRPSRRRAPGSTPPAPRPPPGCPPPHPPSAGRPARSTTASQQSTPLRRPRPSPLR